MRASEGPAPARTGPSEIAPARKPLAVQSSATSASIIPLRRASVRDRWYRLVIRHGLVTGSCRELLAHIAVCHMTDLGHVKVPRRDLATALDVAEHRITVRIGEAVKVGLLTRVGGGKNGQTMQYAASFPGGQGVASRHPEPEVEVSGLRHPQNDTLRPVPGCRDATPIRARATYVDQDQEPAPTEIVGHSSERSEDVPETKIDSPLWHSLEGRLTAALNAAGVPPGQHAAFRDWIDGNLPGAAKGPRWYLHCAENGDLAEHVTQWRDNIPAPMPPKCGECDVNRQLETSRGMMRCPRCHPLAQERGSETAPAPDDEKGVTTGDTPGDEKGLRSAQTPGGDQGYAEVRTPGGEQRSLTA